MSNPELDPELRFTAQRVAELGRRVTIDPQHKARLREELVRRHQELTAGRMQCAAGTLWPRWARLKRLTLVAPAALAAAMVFSLLLWALQISGHQPAQRAEAARLTQALTDSVPTVTAWTVHVTMRRDDSATVYGCLIPLKSGERLYVRDRQAYFFSYGTWYRVTAGHAGAGCPEWQWAFTELPSGLAQPDLRILPAHPVDGQPVEEISYSLARKNGIRVLVRALVEKRSGLVRQLDRVTRQGSRVIEQDSASYGYQRET